MKLPSIPLPLGSPRAFLLFLSADLSGFHFTFVTNVAMGVGKAR